MAMLLKTHFKIAAESLRRNKVRTFLTCLGIAIGIAAVTIVFSLSGSIQRLITDQVGNKELIVITPGLNKDAVRNLLDEVTLQGQLNNNSNIYLSDPKMIQQLPNVAAVAPIIPFAPSITKDDTAHVVQAVATMPDLRQILDFSMLTGDFLTEGGLKNRVILGHDLAISLFAATDSSLLGRTIDIRGAQFMIGGVLAKIDEPFNHTGIDFDNAMIVDMEITRLIEGLQIKQINVLAINAEVIPSVIDNIKTHMIDAHNGDDNFIFTSGSQIVHPASSVLSIVSSMLTLVASISLVVGGIGIMNIMLVGVAERTREIGIRKAVGATSSNILLQFLFESLLLSFMGAIFGIALGYAAAFLLYMVTPFAPFTSPLTLTILLVSPVVLGIIFGIYPALKAARKNPIVSLKYYR